jgi:hypothetical protein
MLPDREVMLLSGSCFLEEAGLLDATMLPGEVMFVVRVMLP